MKSLERSLHEHSLAMLRAIADRQGVTPGSNVPGRVIQRVMAVLNDAEHLQASLDACSHQARQALEALLATGGRLPVATFERRFGKIRIFGPGRLEQEQPQRSPATASEELWYRGLIFRAFAQTDDGLAEFFYLPDDLLPLLPARAPEKASFQLPSADPSAMVNIAGSCLLHSLCALLSLVQAGGVRLDQVNNPLAWRAGSPSPLRAIWPAGEEDMTQLASNEPGTASILAVILAHDLGWLRARQYRLSLNPTPVHRWLEASRGHQRRVLMDAWRASTTWNDLCRTPDLACEETGSWTNDAVDTRSRVLSLLAQLSPASWYRLDDLTGGVQQHMPDFQRPDGNYATWYIRQRHQQVYLRGFEHWDDVEGRLLRFLIRGPLHWLGAVDLGSSHASPDDRLQPNCFRLTKAGIAWLRDEPAPVEDAAAPIEIMPDFSILVPAQAPLLTCFQVARFTTWEDAGTPFRCRITQSGLQRAQRQGIDPARVLEFVREQSQDQVPENVLAALERWRVTQGQ